MKINKRQNEKLFWVNTTVNACLLVILCCSFIYDTIAIVISTVYHNYMCFGLKWVHGLFQNKIWLCHYSVVLKKRKWNVYVYQKGSLAQKKSWETVIKGNVSLCLPSAAVWPSPSRTWRPSVPTERYVKGDSQFAGYFLLLHKKVCTENLES